MTALVLASASAVRAAMLAAAGVEAETMPARIDEPAVRAAMLAEGAGPRDRADKLAELKALRISARRPGRLVLGADQVLVHDGEVFDKAESRAQARAQLLALRGQTHRLLSAAVVVPMGAVSVPHSSGRRKNLEPRTFGSMYSSSPTTACPEISMMR